MSADALEGSSVPPVPQEFSFQSRLERIASTANYFAVSVPLKVTRALQTRGPVPVSARVNDSPPFPVSLFPMGGGRHYLRVKAEIRDAAKIKGGDRVRVHLTVIDRTAEITLPKDLATALRTRKVTESFHALPKGKQRYIIRWIGEAAKPETRSKRIQAAVDTAREKTGSRRNAV